jgi:hypothetical protein
VVPEVRTAGERHRVIMKQAAKAAYSEEADQQLLTA